MQFCKQVLGVQKGTTNNGVLLEIGRVPITLNAQKAAIKNWERIRNYETNYLLNISHKNAKEANLEWLRRVDLCLSEKGMGNFFMENQPFTKNINNKFFQRANDIFYQGAFTSMENANSKLRTYNQVKKNIGQESYLTSIHNTNFRVSMSKFRLSNHRLKIETGRHQKLPISERLCPTCENEIEDEAHFLIKCGLYQESRKPLLKLCRDIKPNFQYFTIMQKFVFLMTNPQLAYDVAKFIFNAMKVRAERENTP